MNVAFIPVRGGSKSIPLKNIKPICGKPLVYWVVKAACLCSHIDKVYIATDSDKIKETVEQLGFEKGPGDWKKRGICVRHGFYGICNVGVCRNSMSLTISC